MIADESFDALFEAVPDALVVVGPGGAIVRANGHAERLFGYPAGALEGLHVEALMPASAADQPAGQREHASARHLRADGVTGQTLLGLRLDGTMFAVEIALSPLAAAAATQYLASVRDVSTSQRERQALLRDRYDAMTARIGQLALEANGDATVVDALPALLAGTLEIDAVAIVLARRDGSGADVRAAAGALWHRGDTVAAATGSTPLPMTPVVVAFGQGTPHRRALFPCPLPASGSAALMPLTDRGRATGALVAASPDPSRFDHDALHLLQSAATLLSCVLQQRRAEEQLAHSQRLDALGQLTGGIAHDFNNLLTVLTGSLQLLEDRCEGEDARDLVASALRSAGRGAELTRKLLAFGRRQRLMPHAIDVDALLEDVAQMLRRTLGQDILLRVACAPDLPRAYADSAQLEAALLNLALNARDAMSRGGEIDIDADRARVRAERASDDLPVGDYVRITVSDTGCGMAPETLARAMEPFFTTKQAGHGSGLGLSMVYGFARQSQGGQEIVSTPGRGTRVALYLPVADDAARDPGAAATGSADGNGERVLIVEDDEEVRSVAVAFLRASGYRVHAVATADEALQALAHDGRIDLLFSDIMLGPGADGATLARAARDRNPALAVLLASGCEPSTEAVTGAFEVIRKPFRREQLADACARALAGRACPRDRARTP